MRALVVYESIFGSTKQVAEAIARGLSERFEVETAEVEAAELDVEEVDLLVVGGPTHAWGMSRRGTRASATEQAREKGIEPVSTGRGIREWLHDVPRHSGGPLIATFDTKLAKPRWLPKGSAAAAAAKRLEKRGFEMAADPEQFIVVESYGPMAKGELERAEVWGRHLAGKVAGMLPKPDPVAVG